MNRPLVLSSLLAVAMTAIAAPVSALDTIRVGKAVSFAWTFTPVEVGIETGIFAKNNIKVVVSSFRGDARLQQGMASDSVDIGIGSGPGLGFMAKGVPAKGIAAMAASPLNMSIVVLAKSPIKSIKGLKGKKIGVTTVGSLTDWLATQVSMQNGWGIKGVRTVTVGGLETGRAALKTGQVDALVIAAAVAYVLESKKEWRMLSTMGRYAPNFHTHVIFATDKLLKNNPDAAGRFLKAWFQTIDWMKANKAKTLAITGKVVRLPPAAVSRTYDTEIKMFSTDGVFQPKAMEGLKKSWVEMKILSSIPKDSVLIDTRFLPVKR